MVLERASVFLTGFFWNFRAQNSEYLMVAVFRDR